MRISAQQGTLLPVTLLLFAVAFVLNSFAIHDGDYFWHVNTGQWIWEHGSLPEKDPFTFPLADADLSNRDRIVLQQYWLSQLLFYGLWETWGEASVVALRALVHAAIVCGVFWLAWRRADIWRACVLGAATLAGFLWVANERPNLFSCLFTLLLVWLLDRCSEDDRPRGRFKLLALPLLMLLWANMHGGYILGVCIVGAYLVGYLVENRHSLGKQSLPLLAALVLSCLVTWLSPAGPLEIIVESLQADAYYLSQVQEAVNTFTAIKSEGVGKHLYYLLLAFLAVVAAVCSLRVGRFRHALTILGVLALSTMGVRYQIFLCAIAFLLAPYLPVPRKVGWAAPLAIGLVLLSLVKANVREPFDWQAAPAFPADAVAFLSRVDVGPNLFNYYDWGGYLAHRLPDYRVFMDGRGLGGPVFADYMEIQYNEKVDLLERYPANAAVFPMFNLVTKKVVPLALVMTYAPQWVPVFIGENALVFVRNSPQNRAVIARYQIGRPQMLQTMATAYGWMLDVYPNDYTALVTLAQLKESFGDLSGAIALLERAVVVKPDSEYAPKALARLQRKLRGGVNSP